MIVGKNLFPVMIHVRDQPGHVILHRQPGLGRILLTYGAYHVVMVYYQARSNFGGIKKLLANG